jgi:hypothetical protein
VLRAGYFISEASPEVKLPVELYGTCNFQFVRLKADAGTALSTTFTNAYSGVG